MNTTSLHSTPGLSRSDNPLLVSKLQNIGKNRIMSNFNNTMVGVTGKGNHVGDKVS
ncbi:hypothetical protein R8510_04605 [Ralstonia chuxiongensis]|nr:hypothetical protein R8510_04605 [Ralstonia chuxiongensis]